MICYKCVHFKMNVSEEKFALDNYCEGCLGSDGHYTWRTPMWANMPQEIWDAVANQAGFSNPETEQDCSAFSKGE